MLIKNPSRGRGRVSVSVRVRVRVGILVICLHDWVICLRVGDLPTKLGDLLTYYVRLNLQLGGFFKYAWNLYLLLLYKRFMSKKHSAWHFFNYYFAFLKCFLYVILCQNFKCLGCLCMAKMNLEMMFGDVFECWGSYYDHIWRFSNLAEGHLGFYAKGLAFDLGQNLKFLLCLCMAKMNLEMFGDVFECWECCFYHIGDFWNLFLKLINNSWRENKGNHYCEGGLKMWS